MKTQIEATKAKAKAYQLTQEYFIDRPKPVPIEDIAMDKKVVCISGPLTGCLARLVRKGKHGVIRVSDKVTDSGPRRFAVAHEMGHWFLHEAYTQYFICSASDMLDYRKSPIEAEANIFASELLMPTALFRPLAESSAPTWDTIRNLCEVFDTSLAATALRFVDFCKFECFLALSKNGHIQWVKQKEVKSGLRVMRTGPVSSSSLAHYAFRELRSIPCEEVPTDTWILETFSRSVEISEEALFMPRMNSVLSLITVVEVDPPTEENSFERMKSKRQL